MTPDTSAARFLNECERPDRRHYTILAMSWAGWLFDFYDLMMFSFLLVPIRKTLGVRNTAMGTAFNLARGVQFFTPLVITQVASRYGLGGGISLAAFFALFTGAWVWMLPETRGTMIIAEP